MKNNDETHNEGNVCPSFSRDFSIRSSLNLAFTVEYLIEYKYSYELGNLKIVDVLTSISVFLHTQYSRKLQDQAN